jgi:hypothetical protein
LCDPERAAHKKVQIVATWWIEPKCVAFDT